jgi:predicted glycoside hydrolase/deacetylase ChbG (UPF0249 family)
MGLLALLLATGLGPSLQKAPLAVRLGFQAGDRVLIVNGDDVAMCHGANAATIAAMEKGLMTSGSIMVPCPWFNEIAEYCRANPTRDFGLHLTHTSEWRNYRWPPLSSRQDTPGLFDPSGSFWHEVEQVYAHATPDQTETEARAQIKKALAAGIDVTHLDSHMGAMQYHPEHHERYLRLAREFDLPVRMGNQELYEKAGLPRIRARALELGIVFPDYLIHDIPREPNESVKNYWMRLVRGLKPGVTELYIHAGVRTEEMKAMCGSWETRAAEADVFTTDPDMRRLFEEMGIKRIGWRPLRALQRKERKGGA